MSAIQPDQSLQSFQLSKLWPIEWLKKDFNPSISASVCTQGLIVDDITGWTCFIQPAHRQPSMRLSKPLWDCFPPFSRRRGLGSIVRSHCTQCGFHWRGGSLSVSVDLWIHKAVNGATRRYGFINSLARFCTRNFVLRSYSFSIDVIAMSLFWFILYILGAVTHNVTAGELLLEPLRNRNFCSTHCFPSGRLQYTVEVVLTSGHCTHLLPQSAAHCHCWDSWTFAANGPIIIAALLILNFHSSIKLNTIRISDCVLS